MRCKNYRFIERDYWYQKALSASDHMGSEQIHEMLDNAPFGYVDYTFKFYGNGSVLIIDNDSDKEVLPSELSGAPLDFYIRCRIDLIKTSLKEKLLQPA